MTKMKAAAKRVYIGKDIQDVMELPDLIDIQLSSYERFLQREKRGWRPSLYKKDGEKEAEKKAEEKAWEALEKAGLQGLEDVFQSTFPIESPNGDMRLTYDGYSLDEDSIKFTELDCKQKGITYAIPLKARVNLIFQQTGEIRQKDIYMGDIPIMTERGTFIINGAERVVVSQIHRSPGVIFSHEKGVFSSRIIPYRGSWLEFEIDQKRELIYAKIDRKKRILGTIFLRALGFDSREEIIKAFYVTETFKINDDRETREKVSGRVLAAPVWIPDDASEQTESKSGKQSDEHAGMKKLYRAGEKLHPHNVDEILANDIKTIELIKFIDRQEPTEEKSANLSLDSNMLLNCFEREEIKYTKENSGRDEPTKEEALMAIFAVLMQGETISVDAAEKELTGMFFTSRRYDLGKVGRYKLNKKFNFNPPLSDYTLTKQDIIATMRFLIKVYVGDEKFDDIDHLGNRRVRSVGELMAVAMKTAFSRMERIAKERMSLKETDTIKPQDLISIKPIVAAIKEFFGSSQLSQFMDQVNPLAELTHKRRLNALGPGGLSRDRAGFEVRDVHYTHYGRMCPIETPEGPNIGLIVSLANYTRVNEYGFLETPYRKVSKGVATREIEYLSAMDEDRYYIAQASAKLRDSGSFVEDQISCRKQGDYDTRPPEDIQYMDVSPKQIISVSASLIPFLEHDDANRALMGSNMQRQAVPLVFPEAPRVGTGMEGKCAYDSGVLVKACRSGTVVRVTSREIAIKPDKPTAAKSSTQSVLDEQGNDVYKLAKFQRTNQDTCYNQRPIVRIGDRVVSGQVIADGPATQNGELALGRNILVGFMPWNGYNYEDSILISQRVVKEDMFTSIHIKEFSTEVRETKLGPEKITNEIPNTSEKSLDNLDREGIICVGAKVRSGDILVGKVTPKSETETTPEFKLLNSIFGEKAKEVRDSSLRVPHGIEGTVIDIQRLKRTEGDDLNPGVDEMVKVLIATKRKLREGDKMAGRHGNKGVVARILPEEDMPYMVEDGTPLDLCLTPLGVPSRMNIGQLLETELGWAGSTLDEWYSAPVFQSPSTDQIEEKLKEAELPVNSKAKLRDGRTGEEFVNPIFCGVIYFLKLHHLVDDKMHARSTGPYSLVTQQPLGGKAQFGGQRLGEMEVWALEAYGAAHTLQELLTIKSDDMTGRSKIYEAIVKGEPSTTAGIPESFNVLVQELRGLALDLAIFDSKNKQIPLTEKDEELITKLTGKF